MSDTTAIRRDNPTPIPTRELEALTDGDRETLAALPEGCALLIVQKGPNSGARYLLNTEKLTIGRNPKNEIFFDDVTVSRVHATLERSGKGFTINTKPVVAKPTTEVSVIVVSVAEIPPFNVVPTDDVCPSKRWNHT